MTNQLSQLNIPLSKGHEINQSTIVKPGSEQHMCGFFNKTWIYLYFDRWDESVTITTKRIDKPINFGECIL